MAWFDYLEPSMACGSSHVLVHQLYLGRSTYLQEEWALLQTMPVVFLLNQLMFLYMNRPRHSDTRPNEPHLWCKKSDTQYKGTRDIQCKDINQKGAAVEMWEKIYDYYKLLWIFKKKKLNSMYIRDYSRYWQIRILQIISRKIEYFWDFLEILIVAFYQYSWKV